MASNDAREVLYRAGLDTPLGKMELLADGQGRLRRFSWCDGEAVTLKAPERFREVAETDPFGMVSALRSYFGGELDALDAIPVHPEGTDFQRAVWAQLRKIPRGKTLSYAELAQRVGKPSAVRAVGTANGANPIPIIIPCHRVIGADGSLTGFGGGLPRKKWLLTHEEAWPQQRSLALG